MKLQRFDNNGTELLIDLDTGKVYASQGMVAKICETRSTNIARFAGSSESIQTLPVVDSRGCYQQTKLYDEELILDCITKYNPTLLRKFAQAGLRVYLHKLAGYEFKPVVKEIEPLTALELAKLQVKLQEQLELQSAIIQDQEKDLIRQGEIIDELYGYSSIIRIAKFNNCSETNFSWRRLKLVSENLELEVKKAPCPRYTTKNLYSHKAWEIAYPEYDLPGEDNNGLSVVL